MGLSGASYRARRDALLCVVCAAPTGGPARCGGCARHEAMRVAAHRTKRREQNLCTICKEPTDGRHALCRGCRHYVAAKRQAQYVPRVPDRRLKANREPPVAIVVQRRAA